MKDRSELPPEFVARMERMLGSDVDRFLESFADPPEGLRVNSLRLTPEAFERISPFALKRLDFPREGYLIEAGLRAGKHPYHAAGLYYLQDPSAMVVGRLVGAAPGERVLDLSAAPGGKTTHLAAEMRNTGLLIANDVSRSRASELVGNLERCGVRNAIVTSQTADRLASHFGAYFDRVLLDAPCSGESMFHKSQAALSVWSPRTVAGCARRQGELIDTAARLVRPGGVLVYSTCTFAEEENEAVVAGFLDAHATFTPLALPEVAGAQEVLRRCTGVDLDTSVADGTRDSRVPGTCFDRRPSADRSRESVSDGGEAAGAAAYRLWPHRIPGAGHFVAALRRTPEAEPSPAVTLPRPPARSASRQSENLVKEFLGAVFGAPDLLAPAALIEFGSEVLAVPVEDPTVISLPAMRSGLWVGTLLRGRFEPAHALAMAIPTGLAAARLDLSLDDPRVERYLAGHPVEAAGPAGWIPVCVDGFALGWGKRVGTQVKNHYPKGLRWR